MKKSKENLINFPRRGGNTGRICISTTLLRQKRWLSLAGRSPHPSTQMCGPWPPRWSSSPNTSHGGRGFCLKRLKFSQTAAGCKKADWRVVMRITVAGCRPSHSRAGQILGLKEQNTDELLPSVLEVQQSAKTKVLPGTRPAKRNYHLSSPLFISWSQGILHASWWKKSGIFRWLVN